MSNLKLRLNTNKEIQEYVEQDLSALNDSSRYSLNPSLEKEVSLLFTERPKNWFIQTANLLSAPDNQYTLKLSRKLTILLILGNIAVKEQSNNIVPLLFRFSSLEQMQEVYYRSIFYLRRMEFDEYESPFDSFFPLLQQWNFSLFYLMTILPKAVVHHKISVCQRLADGFEQLGLTDYSIELRRRAFDDESQ